jgi:hypothetical protein
MTTCDELELGIEQHLHGALGAAESASLMAHLETCPCCRAYQASAQGAEAVLNASVGSAATSADWSRVERAVRGQLARLVFGFAAALLLVTGFGILAVWGFGGAHPEPLAAVAVPAATSLLTLVVAAWSVVRAGRLLQLPGAAESLAWLRTDLGRRVRSIRAGRWVLLALALGALGCAVATPAWAGGLAPAMWRWRVVDGIFAAVGLAIFAWVQAYKLPRAMRELSELRSASEP